jgi:hypothetical protein
LARDHARVNVTIWTDPDFRALPPAAQHLYLTLWTSPTLTYCGTHDWRPARMSGLSNGFTGEHLETVAACLEARHFLVIDRGTEEALIRSWARFDGLMKQPRMAVSLIHAYAAVASPIIRQVLVHELRKIRTEDSELSCWGDERVAEVLAHPAISAKDLPPVSDPFGEGFGDGFALGLPQTQPKVWGSVYTPPTPAPAPAPLLQESGDVSANVAATARKRASTAPEDFAPNETNQRIAADRGLDLDAVVENFLDHHIAKGSKFVDWHRALNTWLRRETPKPQAARPPLVLQRASDLVMPPDGLSPAEADAWEEAHRARLA